MSAFPPLNALLAFDAVMRLGSLVAAGGELAVTAGAVGQQLRRLEDWLGQPLFVREVRRLRPLAAAQAYHARIGPALEDILRASRMLRESAAGAVTLAMPVGLSAQWFAPRMSRFLTRHPEITLHLRASAELVDFARDDVDLAIRYFDGRDPTLSADKLMDDASRAFCSPEYVRRLGLRRPEDLVRATLLHNTLHPHWPAWLARHATLDAKAIERIPGIHFDQSLTAIEAARRHQGVVLCGATLVEPELADGVLLEPFGLALPLPSAYYVVHPWQAELRPAAAVLKAWLLEEAAAG